MYAIRSYYVDDRVVDLLAHRDRGHRLRAVSQRFRHGNHVRGDTEALRAKRLAGAPETADYLIENQQDAMRITDLTQALEITFRRYQDARGASDRFYETGGNSIGPV